MTRDSRLATVACVKRPFLATCAFFARYDQRAEDSIVAHELVLTTRPDVLYVVDYDSLGCDEERHGDFCGTPVGRCTQPKLVRGG